MGSIIQGVLGLLLLLGAGACAAVACGCRGVDVRAWDWAEVLRGPYGKRWRSLTTMRIGFGIVSVFLLAGALRVLTG
ncbi:hypothetical protein [Streptomyces gilvifuscus]|uniref:Uncharacterized protein n=1 Tax=Streptomyces gilvifuscus TaxID=1550617 RepID=A0ABT5FXM0_9ACTN|nr:hypothetical protein [Streptomyces gilvifuscus]MDC2957243.1 hypothetical protein [Streptomyces gilvifuscus]